MFYSDRKLILVLEGELGKNTNVCIGGGSSLAFETYERNAEWFSLPNTFLPFWIRYGFKLDEWNFGFKIKNITEIIFYSYKWQFFVFHL